MSNTQFTKMITAHAEQIKEQVSKMSPEQLADFMARLIHTGFEMSGEGNNAEYGGFGELSPDNLGEVLTNDRKNEKKGSWMPSTLLEFHLKKIVNFNPSFWAPEPNEPIEHE
ncbi:hypothetical protein COT97_01670 [Candidatus Falkowbacteria bacterium CG10_big_fil_rev_8_21_14_0_10_39_11]|uniref:Uncharacterized protein n=1 Tax=Candidatus Falkowbacteria bacterium CG10_big_fil_rev_8_21_14_0_10_39_11 TaxID=1974565 RepID=A0A2H0V5K9_9BACT|nr:MAG: hypothetical protein COT97_01670 [Candidatus Falkowbacteria bacterium CG10_big_fil_rev_8_21_14_0_10_39_11]